MRLKEVVAFYLHLIRISNIQSNEFLLLLFLISSFVYIIQDNKPTKKKEELGLASNTKHTKKKKLEKLIY